MNKEILVIEDNQDVRENLCEILELAGYQTRNAENGKKGLMAIYDKMPDLIICDVMMPELDGNGVLKILRSKTEFKNIPFLFLTAKSEQADFRKGMGLGADDYITKPFDESDLLEALRIRLEISSARLDQKAMNLHNLDKADFSTKINELCEDGEEKEFKSQDYIVKENQIIRQVGVIQSGVVRKVIMDWEGRELTTDLLAQGDLFGWETVLQFSENYAPYALVAIAECTIIFIEATKFSSLVNSDVGLKNYLFNLALKSSLNHEHSMLNIAYMNVRQKVALALLKCATIEGGLGMKRDEMATLVGISKESFIRGLSEFKTDGIISISNHAISIIKPKALELVSHV